ncbi:MAG: hypothetical protein HY789_11880 [Deltaproteobacteria bacterium]|nr:hypothetical protein [Deltaproteobacteria bacterium]
MKIDFSRAALLLLSLFPASMACTAVPAAHGAEEYVYRQTTASESTLFRWQLETAEMVTITSREEKVLYVNVCDASGATHTWRMQKEDAEVSAQRRENELHIRGTFAGEPIDEIFLLDEFPWFQPLSYSLRNFLLTGAAEKQVFWMIRPDKLKPQKFQASKQGVEAITIGTDSYQAVKIKICPTGVLAGFWHAYYWFRPEDGLFLRYEGTHGPPGTPKTVISLAHPPSAHS